MVLLKELKATAVSGNDVCFVGYHLVCLWIGCPINGEAGADMFMTALCGLVSGDGYGVTEVSTIFGSIVHPNQLPLLLLSLLRELSTRQNKKHFEEEKKRRAHTSLLYVHLSLDCCH